MVSMALPMTFSFFTVHVSGSSFVMLMILWVPPPRTRILCLRPICRRCAVSVFLFSRLRFRV